MSVLKKILMIVLLSYLLITFNNAQKSESTSNKKKMGYPIYFKSSALFKCNIKLRDNYNPDKKHQLVIGLHGGGSSLESFINLWDKQKTIEFIYIVPRHHMDG